MPHPAAHIRCLAATAAIALLPVASAQALPTLHHGDRGRSVAKLQRALHLGDDGVFGRGTLHAVKRFQRQHGLTADGVVGAGTWRMLRRSLHRHASARAAAVGGGAQRAHPRRQRAPAAEPPRRDRRRRLRPGHGARGAQLPARARADRRRRRRPRDLVGARHRRRAPGAQARPPARRAARRSPARSSRAISAANRIAAFPYRWGGGHRSFHDSGYDCSGSVSYVLHATGRLGRPRDSGELMSWGQPGRGRWITVYANAGHTFMVIRGRRYDTTGRWDTGSRWQRVDRSSAGYVARHPAGL